MLTKKQKIWMWIFLAMFALPEILFFTTLSSIINYSGKDFLTLSSYFVDSRFFIDNPFYFFVTLVVEIIGIAGLALISFKTKKKIIGIILFVILFWLIFVLVLGYFSNSISLVM